ncbi:MAG: hypothetical protein CVV23_10775 [Ignavibacteriae bacterium HGW-Ignavibacteriae-2]|jgi:hypothetical protein|nr:MAG: hypothetical protein CVV23_10775 [Ignavibacteriae bacterium HGW-Ignavibacteriae-2]
MGSIVYWTIIRTAILIPSLFLLYDWVDSQLWWIIGVVSVYGVIVHPAIIQYNLFMEKNKEIINNTLCSSCKHFDKSAVLCMKHDKHPTVETLPCEGVHWELKESYYEEETNSY